MSRSEFKALIKDIADAIASRPLDGALETFLAQSFPGDGTHFRAVEAMIVQAVDEGWMCEREHGGIRYGRVIEACDDLGGFSVDVVRMDDVVGPHHRHPLGEIDMIFPVDSSARFDGAGRGWKVYGPDSAHKPTVTGGCAYVLYLLPQGQIDFTGKK